MDMNIDDPGRRASRRPVWTAYTRSPYRFTSSVTCIFLIEQGRIPGLITRKYSPNNVFYVVAEISKRGGCGADSQGLRHH